MRVRNDVEQWPGRQRVARMITERVVANRFSERWSVAKRRFMEREKDPVGLKRWFITGTEFEGEGVLTSYANKERRRRRMARRIAHESRRRNR